MAEFAPEAVAAAATVIRLWWDKLPPKKRLDRYTVADVAKAAGIKTGHTGVAGRALVSLGWTRRSEWKRGAHVRYWYAPGVTPPGPGGKEVVEKAPPLDTTERASYLKKITRGAGQKRFVITAAQNATPVFTPFFEALRQYCEHTGAELIVVPYRYHNPTSMWSQKSKDQDWWAPELAPYLCEQRIPLNRHLTLLGDIKTQPTATRPLSGFETITGGRSAIVAHPKLELVTIPTPHHRLPKILTTTGACTARNYTESKAGKKGDFHHTLGACVVEIHGGTFHIRQINAMQDGTFMDMNHEYSDAGWVYHEGVEALVMGDTHFEFVDPDVVKGTFGEGGIVETLRPKRLVWHDIHDFYSRNHHHEGEVFTNFAKHHALRDDVKEWLRKTFEFVDAVTPAGVESVFVPSNHPDALARWVKHADWRSDPRNAVFLLETALVMLKSSVMTDSGTSTVDPFVYWAGQMLKCADRCTFLKRDESYQVKDIELCYHGDKGANGARGSISGFGKIGAKTVIGHSHSPGIRDGAYQVGLSARYRLEYNSGPSSWLQTHCVVYPNGKRSLINIIDGKWRA